MDFEEFGKRKVKKAVVVIGRNKEGEKRKKKKRVK